VFIKDFSQMQNIRDVQGFSAALAFYNQQLNPLIIKIDSEIDGITTLNQNAMFRKKNEASENAEVSIYTLLIISFVAFAGGLILSLYFVNRFLHPIHLLNEGISRVRAGELNIKLNMKTNDEAGRLVYEFNEMTQRLSAYDKSTLGTLMEEKNKSVAIVKSITDPLIVLDSTKITRLLWQTVHANDFLVFRKLPFWANTFLKLFVMVSFLISLRKALKKVTFTLKKL
jgi:nitrogen fixation/metabolism regulation signal transduction histidine kinase